MLMYVYVIIYGILLHSDAVLLSACIHIDGSCVFETAPSEDKDLT
jgi:hypothetical protein